MSAAPPATQKGLRGRVAGAAWPALVYGSLGPASAMGVWPADPRRVDVEYDEMVSEAAVDKLREQLEHDVSEMEKMEQMFSGDLRRFQSDLRDRMIIVMRSRVRIKGHPLTDAITKYVRYTSKTALKLAQLSAAAERHAVHHAPLVLPALAQARAVADKTVALMHELVAQLERWHATYGALVASTQVPDAELAAMIVETERDMAGRVARIREAAAGLKQLVRCKHACWNRAVPKSVAAKPSRLLSRDVNICVVRVLPEDVIASDIPWLAREAVFGQALVAKTLTVSTCDTETDRLAGIYHKVMLEEAAADAVAGTVLRDLVTLGGSATAVFAMTYGSTLCHGLAAPLTYAMSHDQRNIVTVDILQEWSGVSLDDAVMTALNKFDGGQATLELLVGAMAQIVHGVDAAWRAVGFVHHDLHMSNMRIKTIPDPLARDKTLLLQHPDRDAFVAIPPRFAKNGYAKIIDFGRARIDWRANPAHLARICTAFPAISPFYPASSVPVPVPKSQPKPEGAFSSLYQWHLAAHGTEPSVSHVTNLWPFGVPWSADVAIPFIDDTFIAMGMFSAALDIFQQPIHPTAPEARRLLRTIAAACDCLYPVASPDDPAIYYAFATTCSSATSISTTGTFMSTLLRRVNAILATPDSRGLFSAIVAVLLGSPDERAFDIDLATLSSVLPDTASAVQAAKVELIDIGPPYHNYSFDEYGAPTVNAPDAAAPDKRQTDLLGIIQTVTNGVSLFCAHVKDQDLHVSQKPPSTHLSSSLADVAGQFQTFIFNLRVYGASTTFVSRGRHLRSPVRQTGAGAGIIDTTPGRMACLDVLMAAMAADPPQSAVILAGGPRRHFEVHQTEGSVSVSGSGQSTANPADLHQIDLLTLGTTAVDTTTPWHISGCEDGGRQLLTQNGISLTAPRCSFHGCAALARFGCPCGAVCYCSVRHRGMHWITGHVLLHSKHH